MIEHWCRRAAFIALLSLPACDASLAPDDGSTQVRFVNAVPLPTGALDITLEGGPTARLQQGQASNYMQANPQLYPLRARDDGESWTLTGDITVVRGLHQTLIAFGHSSDPGAILVGDEPGRPRQGQFLFRVLHFAPDLGSLDIHFLVADAPVEPARAGVIGMAYPAAPNHFNVNAGAWRVVLTRTGTSQIVHDTGLITFAAGEIHTFVLHNTDNGAPRITRLRDP